MVLLNIIATHSNGLKGNTSHLVSGVIFGLALPYTVVETFRSCSFGIDLLNLINLNFTTAIVPCFLSLFICHGGPRRRHVIRRLSIYNFGVNYFTLTFIRTFFPTNYIITAYLFSTNGSLVNANNACTLARALILNGSSRSHKRGLGAFYGALFSSVTFSSCVILVTVNLLKLGVPTRIVALVSPVTGTGTFLTVFVIKLVVHFDLANGGIGRLIQLLS